MRTSNPHFNPETGAVRGVTTLYEFFHEHSHKEQHTRRTRAWRAREAFVRHRWLRWSGLGLLVALATEWEALRMARRTLKERGLWNDQVKREAANAFGSHVERLLTKFS